MFSVALDIFQLNKVTHQGKDYDCMVVCVDRHSGWIIAVPCLYRGLTGAKVANLMYEQWRPYGIPSLITTDQGSHFISGGWKTLCGRMGIRQAYSQAYHHQANGRAERAGQQLQEKLRKLYVESRINWVEALPRVLDKIHDTMGEGGYSPYEILFGRERPLANLPYEPEHECEDALDFFKRQDRIDKEVARVLNEKHANQAAYINGKEVEQSVFQKEDLVWYKRPPNTGEKLDSRWLGPAAVIEREGDRSYVIELKPQFYIKAPRALLKPY